VKVSVSKMRAVAAEMKNERSVDERSHLGKEGEESGNETYKLIALVLTIESTRLTSREEAR